MTPMKEPDPTILIPDGSKWPDEFTAPTNGMLYDVKHDQKNLQNLVNAAAWLKNGAEWLAADTSVLDGKVTALDGKVTTLDGQTESLEQRVTPLEGRATSLEGRATTLEGKVTALQSTTNSLDTRVTAMEKLPILEFHPTWFLKQGLAGSGNGNVTTPAGELHTILYAGDFSPCVLSVNTPVLAGSNYIIATATIEYHVNDASCRVAICVSVDPNDPNPLIIAENSIMSPGSEVLRSVTLVGMALVADKQIYVSLRHARTYGTGFIEPFGEWTLQVMRTRMTILIPP